ADWILVREIALSERFVNDHNRLCTFNVAVVKEASGAQRNPHRAEVVGAHLIDSRGRLAIRRKRRLFINAKRKLRIEAVDDSGVTHAWNSLDPFEQLLVKGGDPGELSVSRAGRIDLCSQDTRWF